MMQENFHTRKRPKNPKQKRNIQGKKAPSEKMQKHATARQKCKIAQNEKQEGINKTKRLPPQKKRLKKQKKK